MLKINKKIIIFSFFFLFFVNINQAFSAEINLSSPNTKYQVGDIVTVKVFISSDKSVNAVSANLYFPTEILSFNSFSKSSSLINLWAYEPSYSNSDGSAIFEGIIMNSYTGNNGDIITLFFEAKKAGVANLYFRDVSILANDGNGTDIFSGNLTTGQVYIENESKVENTNFQIDVEKPINLKNYAIYFLIVLASILLLEFLILYFFGHHLLDRIKKMFMLLNSIPKEEDKLKQIEKEISVIENNTNLDIKNNDK